MTIQEAYLRSLQKNEQNLANGGIKLDPGRFVLLFNEAQDRLIRYYLNRKDDETIRSIQTLLVYWKSLNKINHIDDPESTSFGLPDDYDIDDIMDAIEYYRRNTDEPKSIERIKEACEKLYGRKFNAREFDARVKEMAA